MNISSYNLALIMDVQRLGQKLLAVAAGVSLTLTSGSLGTVLGAVQPQQSNSVKSDSLADGTYLYGEAPQPDQIGKGYVLFNHQQGKVLGALYYPHSEFDCFTGSLENNTLDVESVGAYDSEVVRQKVNLSDLHQIGTISANDQRILLVCRQETAALRPTALNDPAPYCGKQLER